VTRDLVLPAGRVDNLVRLDGVPRVPPHVVEAADLIVEIGAGKDLSGRNIAEQARE
jgi:hypothetical protein